MAKGGTSYAPAATDFLRRVRLEERSMHMEQYLTAFVEGRAAHNLTIVYSDMHWLWGGVTITLSVTGVYECLEHQRESIIPELIRKTVRPARIQEVIILLRELRAWEQQTLERAPMRDEVRATLILRTDEVESSIWELYNKLERNNRLVRIRKLLLELAKDV
jgi:hypothetical protein